MLAHQLLADQILGQTVPLKAVQVAVGDTELIRSQFDQGLPFH